MKTISIAVLLLSAVVFSAAEDDGHYRPQVHGGDDGQYHPDNQGVYLATLDGRYQRLAAQNGKYNSIYAAYQPTYEQALNRELLAPLVNYGSSVDQDPYASSISAVTYRPIVTTTYRPFVYSTPRPIVYSTPRPIVYSTPRPIVYSTPAPPVIPSKQVYARTQYNSDKAANIIRQDNDHNLNSYHFAYQADNGIAAEEQGAVEPSQGGGTRVRGFYEYIGPDGVTYRVDYTADENGFRPVGRHLPVLGAGAK